MQIAVEAHSEKKVGEEETLSRPQQLRPYCSIMKEGFAVIYAFSKRNVFILIFKVESSNRYFAKLSVYQ